MAGPREFGATLFFQNSLPSVFTHMTTRSVLPSTLVRKMRSSQTAGVEPPGPGRSSFQAMFLVALHEIGRPFSAEWPSRLGPRHCGQLSAWAMEVPARRTSVAAIRFIIVKPLLTLLKLDMC